MTHWTLRSLDEPSVLWLPPTQTVDGYVWGLPQAVTASRWQYSVGTRGPNIQYNTDGAVLVGRISVWLNLSILPGSYLWQGKIEDLPEFATPSDTDFTYRVISIREIRSLVTNDYVYKVYLDED